MVRPKLIVCHSPRIELDPIEVVKIWVIKQTKLAWPTLERQDYDYWRKRAGIKFASSRWLVNHYGSWSAVVDKACQDLSIVNPTTSILTVVSVKENGK